MAFSDMFFERWTRVKKEYGTDRILSSEEIIRPKWLGIGTALALIMAIPMAYKAITSLGSEVEAGKRRDETVVARLNDYRDESKIWYNDALGKIDGINDDLRKRRDAESELGKRVKDLEKYMPAWRFKENLLEGNDKDVLQYVWNVFEQHAVIAGDGIVYELVVDKGRTARQTAYRKLTGEDAPDDDAYVRALDNALKRTYPDEWDGRKKDGSCTFRVK